MTHLQRAFYSLVYCTLVCGPLSWWERLHRSFTLEQPEEKTSVGMILAGLASAGWVVIAAYAARPLCSAYLGLDTQTPPPTRGVPPPIESQPSTNEAGNTIRPEAQQSGKVP